LFSVLYSLPYSRKGGNMADINRPPMGPNSDVGAYLGPGTKINGKLSFDGATTIDGEVEGEIVAKGNVTVGQQATVKGKISAASILIQGNVMANVQADKRIEIQPPGVLLGDVSTQSLIIGDGAILEGHCSMKKEGRVLPLRQEPKEPKSATSKESGS
jgi:cytoskeletal protein CcmA (bactofilin family)